jgi:hypothetical protein
MADARVKAAFDEVYSKEPKTVKATGKTGKAKQKMMVAVALSKARAAGADVPKAPERKKRGAGNNRSF